jgi:quercetin dioxygenase-like cupin family protein
MAIGTDRSGAIFYGLGGGIYRVVAACEQTDNAFFAFEATEPPGGGPPLHIQTREEEFFFVLEGEFTFWLDGHVVKRSAGGTAFVPRGMPHCFKNTSPSPSRMLILFAPGGIEGFFEYAKPLANGQRAAGRRAHRKGDGAGAGLRSRDPRTIAAVLIGQGVFV